MSAGTATMQAILAVALEDLHTRIAEVVIHMDSRALNWQPAPAVPSGASLIAAVTAEEHRLIAEAIAGSPPRVIPSHVATRQSTGVLAEPAVADHPLYEFGSVGQMSQTILLTLPATEWQAPRKVEGKTVTVAYCVLRVLEELARTLGGMEMIARLWDAR